MKPRLSAMPPTLATLQPLIASSRDEHGHSRTAEPWRGWYSLARWKRLRWQTLVRDLFTCQWPGCGKLEPDTSRLVADHKTPHRGDPALFWNGELWTLCESCHASAKQAEERRG